MKLSIITINYNNCAGLLKTIESVISQTCKDFEWIIIDGGSVDGSKGLIEHYVDYVSYWVSEPDKGIYNAMNKGLQIAKGEYFLFLNSGDCLFDTAVLSNVIPLLKDKDIYVGGQHTVKGDKYWELSTTEQIVYNLVFDAFPHQSTFFHRDIFQKYGLYREDKLLPSDWWLTYKSLILGNASVKDLPLIISDFDLMGISCVKSDVLLKEKQSLLDEHPRLFIMHKFYHENLEFINALKATNWFFFIFRIYFYFYRKWLKKSV